MKPRKRILLLIIALLTILSLLLAACGPLDDWGGSSNNGKDQGRDKDPGNGKDKDVGKDKDKDQAGKADKVLICHRTGSAKNPYVQIHVANDSLKEGHGAHAGDLVPAPEGGCPETWTATDLPAK